MLGDAIKMMGENNEYPRAEKLLLSISQGDAFKDAVRKIRAHYDIPVDGYDEKIEIGHWYAKHASIFDETREEWNRFKEDIHLMCRNHAFPLNTWWECRLITYILSNDKVFFLARLHPWQTPFVELIGDSVTPDGSYKDIRIYERASQQDVKDLLQSNWKYLKPSFRIGTVAKIRKQNPDDAAINKDAVRMMKMTKEELGITTTVKENTIGGRLSKVHGKPLTGDAIKARAHRTRKRKQ